MGQSPLSYCAQLLVVGLYMDRVSELITAIKLKHVTCCETDIGHPEALVRPDA